MIKKLDETDYISAAQLIQVDVATIKAIAEVESNGDGFLSNGKPKILFEAHIFSKLTGGKYDITNPDISCKKWNKSLYLGGEKEYDRYQRAYMLDSDKAIQSTSYGKFQIMGFNFNLCGYRDVAKFVQDMGLSEGKQLNAFINFILSSKLHTYLRKFDWVEFAKRYNGTGYEANRYDKKLEESYKKFKNML